MADADEPELELWPNKKRAIYTRGAAAARAAMAKAREPSAPTQPEPPTDETETGDDW